MSSLTGRQPLPQPCLSGPTSSHGAQEVLNGSFVATGEGQFSICDSDPMFSEHLVYQSFPFLKSFAIHLLPFLFTHAPFIQTVTVICLGSNKLFSFI